MANDFGVWITWPRRYYLLCAGAPGYGFGERNAKSDKHDMSYMGIVLLSISVFSDAFTPTIKQRLMSPPPNSNDHDYGLLPPSSAGSKSTKQLRQWLNHLVLTQGGGVLGVSASILMTNYNFVGGIGIVVYKAASRALFDAIGVAFEEPRLFGYLTLIGLSLAVAAFAYARQIKEYGRGGDCHH